MMELWVRRDFDAAHDLSSIFPVNHKCHRLHGHRYTVTLTIKSKSDNDLIVDYHELGEGLEEILQIFDHNNLNTIMDKPPTCENLAREILNQAIKRWGTVVACVEIQEQSNTGCKCWA